MQPFRHQPRCLVVFTNDSRADSRKPGRVAAAASFVRIEPGKMRAIAGMPSWQERIKAPLTSIAVRTSVDRAETYERDLEGAFAERYGDEARRIGVADTPELFYAVLALELMGHSAVFGARKELALLRLIQSPLDPVDAADALRLLRQGVARSELDLTLRRFRSDGPLSALSSDARQILRMRRTPELLRTVEMKVLSATADLFTVSEARDGLDSVLEVLTADGPFDLPGSWELALMRSKVAWETAAALGRACAADAEVAELLLSEAAAVPEGDQLLDSALHLAVRTITWERVPERVQAAWLAFLDSHAEMLPGALDIFLKATRGTIHAPAMAAGLDALIRRLNAVLQGGSRDPSLGVDGVEPIRVSLAQIRASALEGSYSFPAGTTADVAAGLVLAAGADQLWPDLTDFLLDARVQRSDRSPAFERLARSTGQLPPAVAESFRERAEQLVTEPGPDNPFDSQIVPYPAALRFVSVHSLVGGEFTSVSLTRLAGSMNKNARQEAAVTLASLAGLTSAPKGELLVLALTLSQDGDVDVRAAAGRALAVLCNSEDPLAPLARHRLSELLDEDGLLAPLLVLRGLLEVLGDIPGTLTRQVMTLAIQHPSASVRLEAVRLLLARMPQGDPASAEAAYQIAIDSGLPDQTPTAAYKLGLLRENQGDIAGAAAAYEMAIDSGHADAAPQAAVNLGLLRKDQGDPVGAAAAYQLAIDSGHADAAPQAAVNLGLLRKDQGDPVGAAAAYQLAIDSADPNASVLARELMDRL